MEQKDFTNSKGVIDERRLIRILSAGKILDQTKAVSKPSAQITTMCGPVKDPNYIHSIIGEVKEKLRKEYAELYHVFNLQELNGLRISEVLSIRPYDITSTGHVRIKGLKRSKDRVIVTGDSKEYLLRCKRNNLYPFAGMSRFFVYRVYKKLGISFEFGGNKKRSVTHSFRHLVVLSLKESGVDLFTQQQFIGHKSAKSTEHYGKD